MLVTMNGSSVELEEGTTVASLLDRDAVPARGVAVAVNEEVVPRSTWAGAVLADGDRVEVLRAAQGG